MAVLAGLLSAVGGCGDAHGGDGSGAADVGDATVSDAASAAGDGAPATPLDDAAATRGDAAPSVPYTPNTTDDAAGGGPGGGGAEPDSGPRDPGGEPDPAAVDSDGDGVPDDVDLYPADATSPGVALENTVYAHTATELYYLGIKTYSLHLVGPFTFPDDGGGHEMTDIAIDGYGQLFGVTFDRLYSCHPQTAVCVTLALLTGTFNGLTMVPRGVLDDDRDVLVGITKQGAWVRLDVGAGQVTATTLGEYGGAWSSSGDAFSIFGVGTFAAADKAGSSDDHIVVLDPASGAVVGLIGPLPGYAEVFGLAGWTERAFAFDAGGDVLVVDILDGTTQVIVESGHAWWGAGVRTRIPAE